MEVNVGDLVGISMARHYNHGCRDFAVAKVESVERGNVICKVVEAQSCHSCWQVGHDAYHVFAEVGDELNLSEKQIEPANSADWRADVQWDAS